MMHILPRPSTSKVACNPGLLQGYQQNSEVWSNNHRNVSIFFSGLRATVRTELAMQLACFSVSSLCRAVNIEQLVILQRSYAYKSPFWKNLSSTFVHADKLKRQRKQLPETLFVDVSAVSLMQAPRSTC